MGGSASTEIDAPIEAVWALVENVAIAPEWQNGLDTMTPLEHDAQGRPTLCVSVTDAKVTKVKTHVRFSYDGPTKLSWKQEKGDLKRLDGSWTLEDLGNGRTRATYTLDGDTGTMLGLLVRGPVEAKVRSILVDGRPGELKRRMEAG